jgi:hypothetical protein
MDILELLNTNSGIITAIATAALAIVTLFLVRATIQLANITKNQDKPWLHFYYILAEGGLHSNDKLYVKNIGKGAAFEVEYTIKHRGIQYLEHKLGALAPGQKFTVLNMPSNNSEPYEIDEIKYKDINNTPITQQKIEPMIMNFTTYTD